MDAVDVPTRSASSPDAIAWPPDAASVSKMANLVGWASALMTGMASLLCMDMGYATDLLLSIVKPSNDKLIVETCCAGGMFPPSGSYRRDGRAEGLVGGGASR